ncbi:cilia- and flagella-associated protein 61 [Aplysia californica]|uniref:Cilia- and flagella-associated protein 61 n=1 Tax=Aplysia californica TaxID=6500 RepID=A0ABM1A815_APLCA|nr:cilia- and flagella-associated protein 61 [Aplysia californica]
MATPISQDGEAEVITARRTESLDAPHIIKLVEPWTEKLFGRVNIVNVIEKAVLAITLNNKNEEIMGHAAFLDFPNLPDIDSAKWEDWFNTKYAGGQVNSLNALFLHYFVAKKEYAMGCAQEIIRTAFNAVPDLHFLFLSVPVGQFPDPSLAQAFKPMEKREDGQSDSSVLFVCRRHDHVPVLHIRQAFVEDHDDLTPIFNRQSDMLHNTYGDYFLAELIEAQDADMHCLVAEVEKTSYGFMSISTDVNLDVLNQCFELVPFNGLRKPHPDDITQPPPTPPATPPTAPAEDEPEQESLGSKSASTAAIDEGATEGVNGEKSLGADAVAESSPKGSKHSSRAGSPAQEVKTDHRLSDAGSPSMVCELSDYEQNIKEAAETVEKSSPLSQPMTPKELVPPSQKRFVPTYHGAPNAFSIQLFCVAEQYEMRSCDFLVKAFSKFPDRDFCIVTVPHMVPEFPLIQNFVRVTPKCPSVLPQELYVFHRSGLLKNLRVRPACTSDLEAVEKLVTTIELKENILEDLKQFNAARRDIDGTEIQAYVAECLDQVVGVAVVRREEEIEYIRSHYNIEDFIYYNHHRREDHGHLHHFVLNPVFSHLTKHFFKEILRLAHKTCLHYPLYPPYTTKENLENHTLVSGLNALVPVRTRRQIVYPKEGLGINGPSERVLKEFPPYALNHVNRKLVLEPKVTVNARIVVVGASDVGLAYLETLVYCPHLRFNNITLISPHGLPGDLPPDQLRDQVLSNSHCFSQSDYAQMALRTWVNVVYGKMTAIDRTKKLVTVNGSAIVPYDHLVLCTGRQYQVPCPTGADVLNDTTNDQLPQSPHRRYQGPVPGNLFLVNDAYDGAVMLYRAESQLLKGNKKIVIYGHSMDAFTCLQALLKLGVCGSDLTLVEPPMADKVSCFNNPSVEGVVRARLSAAGVTMYGDSYLANWNDGEMEDGEDIATVAFTTSGAHLRLECQAFFCFFSKEVDKDAFTAINCACLVYDGRLVINASFHTNDVSVRAAGTLTKYQRKYHCEPWSHANFNSKEVGIALASEMLRLFDPTLEPQLEPPEEPLNLIPIYRSPNVRTAVLPGDLHYLDVSKPCLPTDLLVQMTQPDYGRELVTGQAGGGQDYFRLHVNHYKSVENITCLAKQPFPADNFLCLFGVHERTINNLLSRFDEGLVKDFYKYLMEPWALAIYHDRFADFRDEIRELLITSPKEGASTLEDLARQLVDEETGLTSEQRKELMLAYVSTGAKRAVETRLLNFMSYNHYHLPFYAKPGMV